MCGIAGIISKQQSVQKNLLAALDCLQHRGPNREGTWTNEEGNVALGHRRLSIIDLSDAAAQPMIYNDRFVIIHNGELYNYIEIKKELEQKWILPIKDSWLATKLKFEHVKSDK